MTSLAPHGGDALGATPGHPLLTPALSGARDLSMSCQQALLDLAAIQRIPGLVGYWPTDPAYLFEDSAGTVPASVGGVVGRWDSINAPAIQATTAVKPYLRKTPQSGVYWLDSNTSTSALTATLGNLGSSCTVVQAGAEGVTFTEGVTITSTYNIAPAFGFNGDIAIFNRALTATEKALLTRYMQRGVPVLGANLFSNPGFDADTGWVKGGSGWSIAGGVAVKAASAGWGSIYQSVAVPNKAFYYRASLYPTTGALSVFANSGSVLSYSTASQVRAVFTSTSLASGVFAVNTAEGTADNLSLQEIL